MNNEEPTRSGEWNGCTRESTTDWDLYHMLTEDKPVMISELVERSGWNRDVVEASLSRLEDACLIAVMGESVSLLSLSDMLMLNEMMNAPDMPVYIENGVIKAKKQC